MKNIFIFLFHSFLFSLLPAQEIISSWVFNASPGQSLRKLRPVDGDGRWTNEMPGSFFTEEGALRIQGEKEGQFTYLPLPRYNHGAFWLVIQVDAWKIASEGWHSLDIGFAHTTPEESRHRTQLTVRMRGNTEMVELGAYTSGVSGETLTNVKGLRIGIGCQKIPQLIALKLDLKNRKYILYKYTSTGAWAEIGLGQSSFIRNPNYLFISTSGNFSSEEYFDLKAIGLSLIK